MRAEPRESNTAQRLEVLAESIVEAVDKMEVFAESLATRGQNTQTIIHKTDGTGTLAGICVACVVVVLGFIIIENRSFAKLQGEMDAQKKELKDELRDAKAWNEVLRSKVAKLEAQQPEAKK